MGDEDGDDDDKAYSGVHNAVPVSSRAALPLPPPLGTASPPIAGQARRRRQQQAVEPQA